MLGYSTSLFGYPIGTPISQIITPFPNYNGRISERVEDVGQRTLFDFRDQVYVLIQPSNGYNLGDISQSNVITIQQSYTPNINNITLTPSNSTFNGINTSLNVSASQNLTINYNFNYSTISTNVFQNSSRPNSYNISVYNWWAIGTSSPILLSNSAGLSSGSAVIGQQIYVSIIPQSLINGIISIGSTTLSDIFNVTN